jgi:hypothetical protein
VNQGLKIGPFLPSLNIKPALAISPINLTHGTGVSGYWNLQEPNLLFNFGVHGVFLNSNVCDSVTFAKSNKIYVNGKS